jgi:hypothetical protein
MNIQQVEIATIQEAPFNYNLHPMNQLEELKKSLTRFGQFKNIVLWQGYCIAGNGLVSAAKELGWMHLDAEVRDDLSEEDAKVLCVADNATPYLAEPDCQKLQELLGGLASVDDLPGATSDWLEMHGVAIQWEVDDIELVHDFNEVQHIKIVCRNEGEYQEAIKILGRKIEWEKIKTMLK